MTAPQPLVRVLVRLTVAILVGLSCSVAAISGATYDELRAAAVKACQAIDPSQSRSGLFGNPDGYRSYYVQSECFQRAAVEFRDPALCSLVKRRLSFFSSSWGYSPPNCLKLVAEGVAADRAAIEDIKRKYLQAPVRLHDFRLERNGNGRDFDIIPVFGARLRLRLHLAIRDPRWSQKRADRSFRLSPRRKQQHSRVRPPPRARDAFS